MKSSLAFLKDAEERDKWDPPSLFKDVRQHVVDLTTALAGKFGSSGKAW
jgi:fructose-bisphosphate aldolase class II